MERPGIEGDELPRKPKKKEEEEEKLPEDVFTLYMRNKMNMANAISSYDIYRANVESIKLGCLLLSDKFKSLKEEASKLLHNKDLQPKSSSIQYIFEEGQTGNEGYYRVIPIQKSAETTVRALDLEAGRLQEINKQCDIFLPEIIELEMKITNALIQDELPGGAPILPKKRLVPADMIATMLQKEWSGN